MITVGNILCIAGYTFDFENNVYVPPLDIEIGRQNTYVARPRTQKKESTKRLVLTTLYKIIVYMLILWLVPYSLYMAIRDKNIYTFGRSWFQILIALQYYYATSYFSDNHFYENIMCNEKLKKYMTYAAPCLLALSVMLGVLNVSLLNKGFRYNGYDELYNHSAVAGKVLLSILIFFDTFYSYITFTINSCVFVINMLYHKITVSSYSDSLGNYIKNSMNVVRKINIVAKEFSQMKFMFNKTVKLLTPFFSVLNFVGFITIYFYLHAVERNDLSISEFINVILFVIVEIVYIQSIQAVNYNIVCISETISSNSMITTFFGNKRFNRTMPVIEHTMDQRTGRGDDDQKRTEIDTDLNIERHDDLKNHDNSIISANSMAITNHARENSSDTLDHNDIRLDIDRLNVRLMGHKLPTKLTDAIDGDRSSQELNDHVNEETLNGTARSTLNIPHQNTDLQTEFKEYYRFTDASGNLHNENHNENNNVSETYHNVNNNIMKQVMISSISTEQMLDWLVLANIVSSTWKTFGVFGVEFTDTTLISKLFGAGVGVLVTAQLGFILQWW